MAHKTKVNGLVHPSARRVKRSGQHTLSWGRPEGQQHMDKQETLKEKEIFYILYLITHSGWQQT